MRDKGTNRVWLRCVYGTFDPNLTSWQLAGHGHTLFIVRRKEFGEQYVIGTIDNTAPPSDGTDKMFEVFSGPFKSLQAAKFAYLMEDSHAEQSA